MFLALRLVELMLLEETAGNVHPTKGLRSPFRVSISLSRGYFFKVGVVVQDCSYIFSEIFVFIAFLGSFVDLGYYFLIILRFVNFLNYANGGLSSHPYWKKVREV